MSFGTGFGTSGGFGTQQQPPAFGATAQPSTGFSFGTPAPAANTSLFGASTQQPAAGGLTFGTPAAAPAQQPAATGFSFSTPAASAQPTFGATNTSALGTGFGTAAVTSNPGLSFGTPVASAGTTGTGTGSFGLSFGTPASTATTQATPSLGLSFGAPAASTAPAATASTGFGLSFGTPAATTASTGFSLGGVASTTATSQPSFGLSFGTAAATTTAAGLSFGTTTTASTGLTGFNLGGGFGATSTLATASTASTTPAPAAVGLGGVATSAPSSTTTAAKTEQAPKEQLLPNEIQQTVDNFKNFVKQQKSFSSDVARCSVKEFRKVESDIDGLNNTLNEVEKQLQVNRNIAEKLKYDTAKGLQQVEMAQRTYDTPIGLQYENTAPLKFFVDLSDHFEREMQNMRLQIESTDKYIKDNGKSAPLTHQDLVLGMRRIHEIFVALAGHLQALHTQVQSQKEQYLNFRKYMLNDATNVFENTHKETESTINQIKNFTLKQPPMLASGPTPFGNVTHPSVVQAVAQSQPPTYQATSSFGAPLGTTGFGTGTSFGATNTSLFGSSSFGGSSFGTGLQLQKPPTGNKRGKQ